MRYRRNGGAYTAPIFTTYPTVEYDGATLGESVEVELRAHDDAGNLSSTVTAQTTVGDTNDCDGSSATECQDVAAGDYVDSEADPESEMTEDGSSQGSATTASNTAKRYRLQSGSETCKTLRCWTTTHPVQVEAAMTVPGLAAGDQPVISAYGIGGFAVVDRGIGAGVEVTTAATA